jgi:hypothetical protein
VFGLLDALDSLILAPESTSIINDVQSIMNKNLYWAIIRMLVFALKEAKQLEASLGYTGNYHGQSGAAPTSNSAFCIADDDDDLVDIASGSTQQQQQQQQQQQHFEQQTTTLNNDANSSSSSSNNNNNNNRSAKSQHDKLLQCYEKNLPRLQLIIARMMSQSTSDDNVRVTCWTVTFLMAIVTRAQEEPQHVPTANSTNNSILPFEFAQALKEILRTQREPIERLLQHPLPQELATSLEEFASMQAFEQYLYALRDRFTLLFQLNQAKCAADAIINSLALSVHQRRELAIKQATTTIQDQSKMDFSKVDTLPAILLVIVNIAYTYRRHRCCCCCCCCCCCRFALVV